MNYNKIYSVLLLMFAVDFVKMDTQTDILKQSVNLFLTRFYKESNSLYPNENLIMSPLSAEIPFALLSLAARESTKIELQTALKLKNDEFIKSSFKPTITNLNSLQNVTVNIANKIYIKDGKGFELNSDFKGVSQENFDSEIENINFSEAEKAANTINSWIKSKTNDKVKDIVTPDTLSDAIRLLLINTIYFKGDWKSKFSLSKTISEKFYINKKDSVTVDMMRKPISYFPYADILELNAKVLELPYKGQEASMVIILPNEIDGLKYVEDKLTSEYDISNIFNKMEVKNVDISLPKFKIETKIDLKNVLTQMDIKLVFSHAADLGGLLKNDEKLLVSKAIQKAFIEVHETGTEASAASTVEIRKYSSLKEPIIFTVDHPFMFCLKTDNIILFIGKIIKF